MLLRMWTTALQLQCLDRAIEQLGRADVARRLVVPEDSLGAYAAGEATIPEEKFLLLVDLMMLLEEAH